jgi:hypothetical protein
MGRKPMDAGEGQSKNFAMRLSEQLSQGVQRFKEYVGKYGDEEPSTSDVVRDLLEKGLRDTPLGFVRDNEEVLRDIVKAWRNQQILRREWLVFLSDGAHDAYMLSKRDTVDPNLLRNNLLAFRAVITLRDELQPRGQQDTDHYYLSKLSNAGETVLDAIDAAIARTDNGMVTRTEAEFRSRNLHVALRDESAALPEERLHTVIEPFLPGLITLALKGFWYREKRPIELSESLDLYLQQLRLPVDAQLHKHGDLSLNFLGGHEEFPALLDFGPRHMMLSLNYVRFSDLAALVKQPGEGDHFVLQRLPIRGEDNYEFYERTSGLRIWFSAREFDDLKELFSNTHSHPVLAEAFAVLDRRYGRV